MKEIKFACPQCGQHIACDRDYVDMCLLCPSCGHPMEVPRLSPGEAEHPEICLVASTPTPKRRFTSHLPAIDVWTEHQWEERCLQAAGPAQQLPAWLVCALGTLVVAAVLKAVLAPVWGIVLSVLLGTVLSCYLLAKNRTIADPKNVAGTIGLFLLAVPALALGLLFIGCATGCR
jgi:hypothetical protein